MDVVYTGLWVDHDRGPVLGMLWTIKTEYAVLMVSFLTILITVAGGRSWAVFTLVLHSVSEYRALRKRPFFGDRAPLNPRMNQVILRNSETAGGAFVSFLTLLYKRSKSNVNDKRGRYIVVAYALFAVAHLLVFAALGLLASQVVKTGGVVRAKTSPVCGLYLAKDDGIRPGSDARGSIDSEIRQNFSLRAEEYVRTCYGSNNEGFQNCNLLLHQTLPYRTEPVGCPFADSSVCIAKDNKAFAMDTGNISLSQLGLNSKYAKRIFVRARSVCSPIATEPFIYSKEATMRYIEDTKLYVTDTESFRLYAHLQEYSYDNAGVVENITVAFRNYSTSDAFWDLRVIHSKGNLTTPPLRVRNSESRMTVVTLRGPGVTFDVPSTDPFLDAQRRFSTISRGVNVTFYRPTHPFNSIACEETIQYCSEITKYCSPPLNPSSSLPILSELLQTVEQLIALSPAIAMAEWSLDFSSIYNSVLSRGTGVLLAANAFDPDSMTQLRVLPDQWKLEVENWFRASLARIQLTPLRMAGVGFGNGINHSLVENIFDGFNDTQRSKIICESVKFRSSKYASLSCFGMFGIVVFTAFVTAISLLEHALLRLPLGRFDVVVRYWDENENLELLKASIDD